MARYRLDRGFSSRLDAVVVGCVLVSFLSPSVFCMPAGLMCDFETSCKWHWDKEIVRTTGRNISNLYKNETNIISGPKTDYRNNSDGHFLHLMSSPLTINRTFNVTSPWFNETKTKCEIQFVEHSFNVARNAIQILVVGKNVSWVATDKFNLGKNKWQNMSAKIGVISQPVHFVFELKMSDQPVSHLALDDIRMVNCAIETTHKEICESTDFICSNKICVNRSYICDLHSDCLEGEDESQDCDKIPPYAQCDFENDANELCEWKNERNSSLEWKRFQGSLGGRQYPPSDNTYKNSSGHFIYIPTGQMGRLGESAKLTSPTFPPPPRSHGILNSPYHNSCQVRFYYFFGGSYSSRLELILIEDPPHRRDFPKHQILWEKASKNTNAWERAVVTLPRLLNSYRLQFVGSRAIMKGNIFLDDITLSPECFGIGVNATENISIDTTEIIPTDEPPKYTMIRFSTCGGQGRYGPNNSMCQTAYKSTGTQVTVLREGNLAGIQAWTVNDTGYYSVIAKGASGGKGARNYGKSHGAIARAVFHWTAGDVIYFLVGQEGSSSCQWGKCRQQPSMKSQGRSSFAKLLGSKQGSGGGGGGATYVFIMEDDNPVPLLVAGGGGGLSFERASHVSTPDGQTANDNVLPVNGAGTTNGAGGGGGWNDTTYHKTSGRSLILGGEGGEPCEDLKDWEAIGGFGGGGGACLGGGGGGGYKGGDAPDPDNMTAPGEGGVSFAKGKEAVTLPGAASKGPGVVEVIPAFEGCNCSHLCVVLNPEAKVNTCICPDGWLLADDNITCQVIPRPDETGFMLHHLIIIILCAGIAIISIGAVSVFLYHRYRRRVKKTLRQESFGNPELQLNWLRQQSGGMITDPNPNYEFGGSTCTLQDLKEVNRENLTLIKPLGQGAFGEVYQGVLINLPDEGRDLPVAVKTLPELSNSQAEIDFIMEALIMSKFNHPNIVRFVGVCFDKLPKFIVLELLPGGDLKSFLRESRPKPSRPSTLTMCDLLMLAMDIAKGCQYLEENHFIHRDIAARNCLLTTKGPGRVVKIADFGMARDIYRADYYRKGGKAMLPVKWMPPEAFLDGIFTSKTDVWSFGVLLWEVMSLGYMPYPGRGNHEVMQLVTSGGRLEPPSNCPSPVYHIMAQCWQSVPDERPTFCTILERLGYCLQDPDVIHAALPVFHRPPSTERDTTVMRPPDSDAMCLQVQRPDIEPVSPASTDYLIPIPSSNYSLSTEKTELPSGSSVESIDKLLELEDKVPPAPPAPSPVAPSTPRQWETSFGQDPQPASESSPLGMKRRGGYTSLPTHDDSLPPPPAPFEGNLENKDSVNAKDPSSNSCRSPPASIARQRPTAKKAGPNKSGNLISLDRGPNQSSNKSGISLDASALARQHLNPAPPYGYVNVDMASPYLSKPHGGETKTGDTYIIGNHYVERNLVPEKEISC